MKLESAVGDEILDFGSGEPSSRIFLQPNHTRVVNREPTFVAERLDQGHTESGIVKLSVAISHRASQPVRLEHGHPLHRLCDRTMLAGKQVASAGNQVVHLYPDPVVQDVLAAITGDKKLQGTRQ